MVGDTDDCYTLEIARCEDDFRALKKDWDELANRCGSEGFFASHVFADQSWQRCRVDRANKLHVITIWWAGRLIFGVPLIKRSDWLATSTFQWLNSKTPLYDDVLMEPEVDIAPLAALVARHLHSFPLARKLKVPYVRGNSAAERLLLMLGAQPRKKVSAPAIDLTPYGSWEDFLAGLSAKTRQARGRLLRRLAEHGAVRFETITKPADLEPEIAALFAEKRHWVERRIGHENWLSAPETEGFFRSVTIDLAATGQACVQKLSCGDERIASNLIFQTGDTVFLSKTAFDPLWGKYSPGWLLTLECCRLAIQDGYKNIDLMIGQDEWKKRVANVNCRVTKYMLPLWTVAAKRLFVSR